MEQPRLREVRESKRMTISQLARQSGVSRNTIYRLEGTYGNVASLKTLEDLAKALGVPLTELLA